MAVITCLIWGAISPSDALVTYSISQKSTNLCKYLGKFRRPYNISMGTFSLVVLIFAAIAFSAGGIALAKVLVKGSKNPQKGQTYECGVPSQGSSWIQFNVGYYLFALIFLIFDVELIFLYPWAVVVKKLGMVAFAEILIFLFILFMGFLYAHKKGALKWI